MKATLPLRKEVNVNDTWKLEDLFETDEACREALYEIERQIPLYAKYKGHLSDSAECLYECIQFDESVGRKIDMISCYTLQKSDEDTADPFYQELAGLFHMTANKLSAESAFMAVEIGEIGREKLEAFMDEFAPLKAYALYFERILRTKPYTRSDAEEKLLAGMSSVSAASADIYKMFNNADLKFAPVKDSAGNVHEITKGTYIHLLESSDRVLRRNAYESVYSAYGSFKNTLAAMFTANLKQYSFYTRTRGHAGPVEYALFKNAIPSPVYDNLLEAVHDALPFMYRYVALRKKMLGVEDLGMHDVYVPVVKDPGKKYSFEEAKAIVLDALKPMGEEYIGLLKEAFENRWIDIYENQGKRSGAYSNSCYDCHPYVLLNFNGTLDSVFTLAHELGHALHSWYSHHNQPYTYAYYKIFVAEGASTCNEALLNQYLMERAGDDEEKAYIINNFLDSIKGTIFRQTMFAEFEKITHEKMWNGEALSAQSICEIYKDLNKLYFGPDMNVDDFIAMEWARIPHFYRPFYVYQYATGLTAALALSNRILTLGEEGVNDYKKFLKGGCSMTPIELLQLAGVDMTTKEPVNAAMAIFNDLLMKLEELTCKNADQ